MIKKLKRDWGPIEGCRVIDRGIDRYINRWIGRKYDFVGA
jgi:hypothetical protein